MNRDEARRTLLGIQALPGCCTPTTLKAQGHAERIPHARSALRELATMGAATQAGPDAWAKGPRFDDVYAAADWCDEDGTPDPGWPE